MKAVRIIFQIIIGVIFAAASVAVLLPGLAALNGSSMQRPITLIAFGLVMIATAAAPNIRRAFGRSFLFLGASVFLLPLSTMLLSGVAANEVVNAAAAAGDADQGMALAGSVVAGGLATAFAGFVGFILGSVLLIAGLILSLGGRREVVVVQR